MKRLHFTLLLLSIVTTLSAQVTHSGINGTIVDDEAFRLQGATVTAIDQPTGTAYHAVADVNGVYRLQDLRPGGPYSLTFQMLGYHTQTIDDIWLNLGQNMVINVTMYMNTISLGEITVAAETPTPDHGRGIITAVSSEQISALPTVSRSINDVISLSPHAATNSLGLAIGGGNFRQSYVTVDGASFHNAYGLGSNLPAGGTPITLDALESVSISIAPFDVRQSGFTGGSVNAVTKSGSNQLHVSLYDYFTSDKLIGTRFGQANDFGQYPENLRLGQSLLNTTGISVGGPIVQNKLFYFVNFEYEADVTSGQMRYARKNESSEWGGNTQYNRPTVAMMDSIRQYLIHTYNYDPGAYQNYSFSTPDYKLMARLDWNINDNNRFNIRYSSVKHQTFSAPSSSITPFSSSLYNKNVYGRGSQYALYYESSNYIQQQNFSSVAAELNSRFLYGRLTNTLRTVYSKQHEPRELTRDVFPTVDILEPLADGTKALYTSFGPDPFTYGTGSTVHSFIATEELSYYTGIHHLVGGMQFEFEKTVNRFMQGGAGYYVYNSWDDFVNQATPAAFTIAYGNNANLEQAAPSFNFFQNSLYLQDEITFTDQFKLTAGLRVEVPFYPSIDDNINNEFQAIAQGDNTLHGLSTADMPKARVDYSPRLGFEWDLLGDRKLLLHGGSGIYTGRLPLVWIVTAVCNSNVEQGTYLTYNTPMAFYGSWQEIIANNSSNLMIGDLPASQIATILDKELRMPQTWKSSMALEAQLPGGITATIDGIYGKDLASVAVTGLGIIQDDSIQLPGEPGKRAHWTSEGLVNSIGGKLTPFYITNSRDNGFYYSVTGQLTKQFDFGLNLMAAYAYSCGKNVSDGIGDQVMSAYSNNNYSVHGCNAHEVGYSSYVSPNRAILSAGWTWNTGQHTTESLNCYYEGYNLCYVGNYSYSRYSYTMTSNVNGDNGAHSLIYIPKHDELYAKDANGDYLMPFVSEENRDAFETFINDDSYLSANRGYYAERGGVIAPWRHTVNLKYERTYTFNDGKSVSLGMDVKNVGNLLHRSWGNVKQLNNGDILSYSGGKYQFNQPTWNEYAGVISTWSAALNLRFNF